VDFNIDDRSILFHTPEIIADCFDSSCNATADVFDNSRAVIGMREVKRTQVVDNFLYRVAKGCGK